MFQISQFRCRYGHPRVSTFHFGNSACHNIEIKGDKRIFKEQFCPGFYNLVSFRWCKTEEAYSFCLGKVKLRKNTTFFYTFKEFIRVNQ